MALIQCAECEGKVSDKASTCPHCGAPTNTASLDPKDNQSLRYSDQEVAVMLSKKKKTSHLLHLILCIPTMRAWVLIWLLCGLSNQIENNRIERKIARGK